MYLVVMCLLASVGLATPSFAEIGYLEYSAGVSLLRNQNLTGADGSGAGFSGSLQPSIAGYSLGAAVGASVFQMMDANLRAEISLSYRSNEVEGMNVLRGQATDASGDIGLFTAMLNAYVDYDLKLGVVPYVGLGIGYGRLEIDAESATSALRITDEASVLAWNVMAGVVIPYTETVDFTGGYRYLATTDTEVDSRLRGTVSGARRLNTEYDVHELTIGMRIKF